jgi:hypothetical protein
VTDKLEARLRAALSARAGQITPESLRPDQPPAEPSRPSRPVRSTSAAARRRFAPLAVAAAALVAVVLGSVIRGLPGWLGEPDSGGQRSPSPGTVAQLDGVAFTPPAGWIYREIVEGIGCVQPAGSPQPAGECTPFGVELRVGAFVGWPQNSLDRDDGWSLTPRQCSGAGYADPQGNVTDNRLTDRQSRRVALHAAVYRVWLVRCDGNYSFAVRVWWVADVALTVHTRALDPRYDAAVDELVASIHVLGR